MTYVYKTFGIIILTVLAVGFSSVLPVPANATPPSDIQLSYDISTQTLTATITHASFVPGIHYIKTVEIKKNGQMISANTYKNQPDKKTFTYTYKIPAGIGDEFEVTATCNMYGSKTVKMVVK
ncbi:MAG TPA: hypothetical protein VIS94_03255 [Desulfomonilia bacterium]|jgi:hypothetical protein